MPKYVWIFSSPFLSLLRLCVYVFGFCAHHLCQPCYDFFLSPIDFVIRAQSSMYECMWMCVFVCLSAVCLILCSCLHFAACVRLLSIHDDVSFVVVTVVIVKLKSCFSARERERVSSSGSSSTKVEVTICVTSNSSV